MAAQILVSGLEQSTHISKDKIMNLLVAPKEAGGMSL